MRVPFDGKQIKPSKGYDILAQRVRENVDKTARLGLKEVSFITFNYDTCLEFALDFNGLGIDYGLSEPFLDVSANRYQVKIPVLKLHGSINWAKCPNCKTIVPTEIDPWRQASAIRIDHQKELPLQLATRISGKIHHCGTPLDPLPIIVPPTWNKSSSTSGLQNVWKRAALELGSAENIVVVGYSLPLTDMFFKYLFALGIDSDAHLEKFIVINGPNGAITEDRFKALLGPMTRDRFNFHSFVFSGAGNIFEEVLNT